MKNVLFVLFMLVFLYTQSKAQVSEKYVQLVKEAWSLYTSKQYLKSAQMYSEAFTVEGGIESVSDRYNAACSWALANLPDSAFAQLFQIAQNGQYSNLSHLKTDNDLSVLHTDERWNKLIELVKANKEKAEAHLDKPLVALLDSIYEEDQKYRQQLAAIEEKYGWESEEMKSLWKIIHEKDSLNQQNVKKILDERGWLGPDVIGHQGNQTLFLVIQHAEIETQEKYLPMMRVAVKKGNAKAASLALLEDRVALRKGNMQIYGSQVGRDQETGEYYVLPLADPDNVDKRRAEVGLEPLQSYLSNWGLTWNVENYKKKLPEYIAKQKG
ncbi:DUF6624 domain-containing protein [Lacibacter sp.]|uniref:DUF6624 domain-containing protein n=1 Tax=Lacibacter sp. TaxID=1915409 RepID=UPI002B4B4385|nr:DUF6624 domain-containing protein [Lacibacter sp.]HLP37975.1 DUF6624 domain-containing protein [Lacibacter sp.]